VAEKPWGFKSLLPHSGMIFESVWPEFMRAIAGNYDRSSSFLYLGENSSESILGRVRVAGGPGHPRHG
jgi:hypothetical protein